MCAVSHDAGPAFEVVSCCQATTLNISCWCRLVSRIGCCAGRHHHSGSRYTTVYGVCRVQYYPRQNIG